jgi:hypothetical protein
MSQNHATATVHGMVPICRKIDHPAPATIDLSCIGGVGGVSN